MKSIEKIVAKNLLDIGAVFLSPNEPFTWASGIKSPIYCDNRLTLTVPEVRDIIENSLAETIKNNFPNCEKLMGTSTAGIAHAAITGYIMKLPVGYVRASSKDHGRNNKIEGKLNKGDKVVVVEDLISTGGSCLDVVKVLQEAGADVLGVVSIFTYNTKRANAMFNEADVKCISLSNIDVLAEIAADEGYIKKEQVKEIIEWVSEI